MASKAMSDFMKASPELPADYVQTTYPEAVAVGPTDKGPHVLQGDLKRDWCIGKVPAGGYLMSVIASATQYYFKHHHVERNQPDLITIHVEFLGRSIIGPCSIHITDLKLGRQFSTVRVQLLQDISGLCLEAHVTQGNLTVEARSAGLTLPTRAGGPGGLFSLPLPPREACVERKDVPEIFARRTSFAKTRFLLEAGTGQLQAHPRFGPSVREQWIGFRGGAGGVVDGCVRGFSVSSLPFICDNFRPIVEAYGEEGNWFPTMCCSVEVKKAPPTESGWDWLFMRIEVKVIRNGRNDIDVVILDEEGDVVALSNHTALIVPIARNLKAKSSNM